MKKCKLCGSDEEELNENDICGSCINDANVN